MGCDKQAKNFLRTCSLTKYKSGSKCLVRALRTMLAVKATELSLSHEMIGAWEGDCLISNTRDSNPREFRSNTCQTAIFYLNAWLRDNILLFGYHIIGLSPKNTHTKNWPSIIRTRSPINISKPSEGKKLGFL